MRTRYKKYEDYGLNTKDVERTYKWLNRLTEDQKAAVEKVVTAAVPEQISRYVFLALTEHKGYDSLRKMGLDYAKNDFYGYKRKGLYEIFKWRRNNKI